MSSDDDSDSAARGRTQPSETDRIFQEMLSPDRIKRLDSVLEHRTASLTVVLDNVHNFHNISAVMRSCDAFGVSELHLVGSQFTYNPTISQGTERWIKLTRHAVAQDAVTKLAQSGHEIVVLCPEEQYPDICVPVSALPFETPLALVFGNEFAGVSEVFVQHAKRTAFIPMCGFVESLNVSVACAICLFCATIEGAVPKRRTAPLTDDERIALRSDWLKAGVRRADTILRDLTVRERKEREQE